jgi:hypothetical protein
MDKKTKQPAGDMARGLRQYPDLMLRPGQQPQPDIEQAEASTPVEEETETGIVADGHTVDVPTGEKVVCGFDAVFARSVFRSVCKSFRPGETVTLPRSEIRRLQQLGFIVDPDKIAPVDGTVLNAQAFKDTVAPGRVNGSGP